MFKIKIGNFTTEITVTPKNLEPPIRDVLCGFITNEKANIILKARLIDNLSFNDYEGPAPATIIAPDTYKIKWHYFSGIFNLRSGIAEAEVDSRLHILVSFLRMIYSIKAINTGGLFVHAASLARDGIAYLFPGKSGTGKTTLVKMALSSDKKILPLSDEISYISLEKGKVFAYSTPFWGNTKIKGKYIKAPLSKIYFIRQSKNDTKKAIKNSEAHRYMLENVLYASIDNDSFNKSFDNIKKIISNTEAYILYFTKSSKFLEVI